MAEKNLGNVVGILRGPTPPDKKHILWAKEVAPGKSINFVYDFDVNEWVPLMGGNPYYQKPVVEMGRNSPPTNPTVGDRYVIGANPTGAWAGYAQYIASWNGNGYDYTPPINTMQIQSLEDYKLYIFKDTAWEEFSTGDALAQIAFNGNRPITRNIPGLFGVAPGGSTVKEFMENAYYPAQNPIATLSIDGGNVREVGASVAVTLNWTVKKTSYPIVSIIVNDQPITPVNGGDQSGSIAAVGTVNSDHTFLMSVTSKNPETNQTQTATASVTLQIRAKRFWFVSNQNLMAMNDDQISTILNSLTDANWEFATSKDMPSRSIVAATQYIYIAYRNSYGVATYQINNSPNTDIETKVFQYENSQDFSLSYRLDRTGNILNGTFNVDVN